MNRNLSNKYFNILIIFIVALAVGLVAGCGQSTSSNSSTMPHGTFTYFGTQSPGDIWSWTIGEGTMIATNETKGKYYSGTFSAQPSGFLKGVITASNDLSLPLNSTAKVYLMEFPNTMLIVKPADSDRLIVCAAQATIEPTAGQYNWIKVPNSGWNANANTGYGTADVSVSGGQCNIYLSRYMIDGSLISATLEAGYIFANGRLIKSGSDLSVFMTPSGLFIGDNGLGSGGFAGLKYEAVNISDAMAKEYRGAQFTFDSSTGLGSTVALGSGPNPAAPRTMRVWNYSDVDNNVIDTSTYATLSPVTQESSGIVSGTLLYSNGASRNIKMAIAKISGKYVVIGIEAITATTPVNFIAIEQ